MKWIMVIWLMAGGSGTAFSINQRRRRELTDMERLICLMGTLWDHVVRWRLPMLEICRMLSKTETGISGEFLKELVLLLEAKHNEDFGEIWIGACGSMAGKWVLPKDFERLWKEALRALPGDVSGIDRTLSYSLERLKHIQAGYRDRYEKEQKLIMASGVLASIFVCLIFW